jgi:hypothetical protein
VPVEYTVGQGAGPYGRHGSILNKGPSVVFVGWGRSITAGECNTDEGENKCYLESGDAVRIPRTKTTFSCATASGSAKLLFVED